MGIIVQKQNVLQIHLVYKVVIFMKQLILVYNVKLINFLKMVYVIMY